MVEDKVGPKEYLGIKIDYDKDKKLQYTQKGEKKIIQQISVDDKKKKK